MYFDRLNVLKQTVAHIERGSTPYAYELFLPVSDIFTHTPPPPPPHISLSLSLSVWEMDDGRGASCVTQR